MSGYDRFYQVSSGKVWLILVRSGYVISFHVNSGYDRWCQVNSG